MTEYPTGWTCELVLVRIERYRTNALPRMEALAMADHFEACAECAERLVLIVVSGPVHE
jgi:hypothetical protein